MDRVLVVAAGALLGDAHAPLAETDLQLATQQERNDPATEQEDEFQGLDGRSRRIRGE
jgi:hypothetical protein